MDHAWASQKLTHFRTLIDVLGDFVNDDISGEHWGELKQDWGSYKETYDRILMLEPIIREIMDAARPDFGQFPSADEIGYPDDSEEYWRLSVRPNVLRAIGIHDLGAEARERLRPESPDLAAEQFHPWVWDSASSLWLADSRQEAVEAAARSVNARLQQKLNRRDASDTVLCREAYTTKEPAKGKNRLRFSGDRSSETWRSRQQGAMEFGAGCFQGIRNPASHEHDLDLPQAVALEQLAAFSILARWIDECEVERYVEPSLDSGA
jgi:hypothetical protein